MASSQLPQTHQVLVLNTTKDPYDIAVVSKPIPKAGPGSAVIQVLASGVLTYADRVYSGKKPYPYPEPFVLGSTAIGRIAGVGPDATRLKPGDLIFFDCFIEGRDDTTALMLSGLSAGFNPRSRSLMEGEWRDSTYANYCRVPLENCFLMDESRLLGKPSDGGLGYTATDLMYFLSISVPFGGLRDVDLKAGEKVIIAPATGMFGSAAVVTALGMGAEVIAVGRSRDTLEQVKAHSPDGRIKIAVNTGDVAADIKELTKDGPADVFYDISPGKAGNSTHFQSCIQSLVRGGRVSLMGAHMELTLPMQWMVLNDITLKGKWMYTKDDMRAMIRLAERGFLKLGAAGGIRTVGSFPLEQFGAAFETASKMRGPFLQTVITP